MPYCGGGDKQMGEIEDEELEKEEGREKWGVNRSLIQHSPSPDGCALLNKAFDTGCYWSWLRIWHFDLLCWSLPIWAARGRIQMHSSARLMSFSADLGHKTQRRRSFPHTEYRCGQESVTRNLLSSTPFDSLPAKLQHEMICLISICCRFHRWITHSAAIRSSLCYTWRVVRQ